MFWQAEGRIQAVAGRSRTPLTGDEPNKEMASDRNDAMSPSLRAAPSGVSPPRPYRGGAQSPP